jgi:hypothetical protein
MTGIMMAAMNTVSQGAVSSGLVYYIDAGNVASYSGSGSSINNISSTGIGASTLANGPVFTSAGTSSYFTFNGSNQTVYTPDMISLFNSPVNENLTLEAWVRTSSDNGVVVSEQGNSPINSGWHDSQLEIVSGSLHVRVWTLPPEPNLTVGSVTRNQWQQYVMTFNAATSTLTGYINGSTTASATSISRLSPQEGNAPQLYYELMYQDGTSMGDGSSLSGDWSVFKVYNRALSQAEVAQNFNALKGRYGL